MISSASRIARQALAVFGLACLIHSHGQAQTFLPTDVGTTVNGFQDDFSGASLNPNWVVRGANVFSLSSGALHVGSASGDPNHLLYELPGYDSTVQEVLARIRIVNFGSGDSVRGGVAAVVDPNSTQGINYLFRSGASEGQNGTHMAFLNDMIAWGPGQAFSWQANTWYWVRLRHEPDATSQGGADDVFGKIWLGDGTVPEPAGWDMTWDYGAGGGRTGFAGITASSGGTLDFDVDYILIKANGLPAIQVSPGSFVQTPVAITNQPKSLAVSELAAASFSVGAFGNPAPSYQWYRGALPISGATDSSFLLSAAAYADNGAQFKVVVQNLVSNTVYSVTSSVVSLTVVSDTNPPVLLGARALGLASVQLTFSERLAPNGATNRLNYTLTSTNGSVVINSVALDASQTNVLLTTSTLGDGSYYTVTVNNLTDQSHLTNPIAPNSQAQFVASSYAFASLGNAQPVGSQVPAGNGYNISAGGGGSYSTNDQGVFSYQLQSGDFDVAVRLDSLTLADAWSEAGLMAREDLRAGGRFVATLATPTISGAFFQSRGGTNAVTSRSGSFPVNYPNLWLRLKRSGSSFSGYGSIDGQNWTSLGSASFTTGPNLYLGFVVSSSNTNQLATAAFRDFRLVTGTGGTVAPAIEGLGQGGRSTSLVISEIMYHPINTNLEFVELFNSRAEPQDLSGYQLGGDISYTFPAGTVIDGGGFVVIAGAPPALQAAYGLSAVYGPYTGKLPGKGGTLRLMSQGGGLLLEVKYQTSAPWPVAADGAGHSLVLARPSYGVNNVLAWAASDQVGGSPGKLDPFTADPLRNIVINEFLAHTDLPDYDYVELYNHSAQPVDISGCILTDNPLTNKFVVPSGTVLAAHGFAYWNELSLNFGLSAAGESVYLKDPAGQRVLDAVRFEGQENGVSTGRFPDGGEHFYRLATKSPGLPNGSVRQSDVVINEIMYDPVSQDDDDQYVELYNRSSHAINLGGWQFVDGISFTFPPNFVLQPDGYLVVARNAARMRTNYSNLTSANLLGDFGGTLSHRGEKLALAMPDTIVVTNSLGVVQTNLIRITVNELTYGIGGRWGQWSRGGGSSLELIDPHSDNTLAANWADSDETRKAPWTAISATGTLDNGTVAADELQLLLQGNGEILVDNVLVIDSSGTDRITGGTFESGATGWVAEGTEKTSGLETTEGYNSAQSYHLRAVEKADNQINRVRTRLTTTLASGSANVTIKAMARWLKGGPEVLLRLRGNWLECAAQVPTGSLGTPGARNSRYVGNAAPAIANVQHSPVLPQAGQSVVVTATVTDPDSISAVALKYRLDPATTYSTVTMKDDGTGGDAVAGDGIYAGTIPGQAAGTTIAFYVQAADAAVAPVTGKFPSDAPAHECLARVGEVQPTGNFPVYRFWMTQNSLNTWSGNSKLDNSYNDVTFVLDDKRVIYNAAARYKGSPYISPGYCGPTCGRCGYSLTFPADDLFLGDEDLMVDWPGGHGGENTAMQEELCYWIADRLNLPWSHRYIIRLHVNGVTDESRQTTFEAVVQPAGGFVEEWSPSDPGGNLYKIERAFEFSDGGGLVADPEPRLQRYTTTGGMKKRERYRWTFMFRSTDRRNDYSDIFALVDAVNAGAPEPYTSATLGLVDIEEWMGIFATEHIVENFDAYGHEIGKNMYAYLPPNGKWKLFMFDLDWAMLAAPNYSANYAASAGPLFNADDPTITRMYAFPPFARAYWRAVQNAVNGPLNSANCNPVIDAKSRSLFANGIQWCDSQPLSEPSKVKTWFSQRRTALQNQLATVAAPFAVTSVSLSNNVAVVKGTSPIGAQTIEFNGAQWPVTWTSVTGWTATVVLKPGTNQWNVVGVDPNGQPMPGASTTAGTVYNGAAVSPVGQVVINEIMYHPLLPDAGYVELYNRSASLSFDLSGFEFNGLSYSFPEGSMIAPNRYLVLAANRAGFATAYGSTNLVFDTFAGSLQNNGETLTLHKAGTNGSADVVVSKVRYRDSAPWPTLADGTGSALQLVDPAQDNWRVGNWAAADVSPPATTNAAWAYFTTTGVATGSRLSIYLQGPGQVYVDDLKFVAGSVPETGPNLLANGNFESAFSPTWSLGPDFTLSGQVTNVSHGGLASLQIVALNPGNGTTGDAVYQDISPVLSLGQPYTLSFWYLQTTNQNTPLLTIELLGAGVSSGSINPNPGGATQYFTAATPGAANGNLTSLPAFPPLWINEIEPQNISGITNLLGQRSGWVELYNPAPVAVSLSGLYLGTNYGNLTQWAFPANATIGPNRFLLVYTDGQSSLGNTNELHAGCTLAAASGGIALSRIYQGKPQVLDFVDYTNLAPDHSYGSVPDGQSFDRQEFSLGTAGASNIIVGGASYIGYTQPGWVYSQNFDALPNPGLTSVNTANPVTIDGITYGLSNPFDFAAPVTAAGNGGLGIPGLAGWYGYGNLGSKFGATDGDQTTGGVLSFGLPGSPNRTLGLLATSSTGAAAFGARLLNQTGRTLRFMSLQCTGELWRQSDLPKTVQFYYYIDPTGNAPFSLNLTEFVPGLDVGFAPSSTAGGGVAVDGTDALNRTNLVVIDQPIHDWPPGAALWLVWEMANPAGRSQGLGIDNLLFSASDQATQDAGPGLVGNVNGSSFLLSWLGASGQSYQVEYKDDLNAPVWTALGAPMAGTGGPLGITNSLSTSLQRFYRVRLVP
jgi:hypothetical protein